jgi:hypothetical protein
MTNYIPQNCFLKFIARLQDKICKPFAIEAESGAVSAKRNVHVVDMNVQYFLEAVVFGCPHALLIGAHVPFWL